MIQHVYGEKKGKQMIKLIATDIDGTLVADGTLDLNPEYYDVIKELKRRGTEQVSRKYSRQYLMTSVLFQKMELVFIPKIINM